MTLNCSDTYDKMAESSDFIGAVTELNSQLAPSQLSYLLLTLNSAADGLDKLTLSSDIGSSRVNLCSPVSISDSDISSDGRPDHFSDIKRKIHCPTDQKSISRSHQIGLYSSRLRLPANLLHGDDLKAEESAKSCLKLQVCKRLLKKYPLHGERSSSTETLKAESLPDEVKNPLRNIAGRIANEPVNPFPTVRKPGKSLNRCQRRLLHPPPFTDQIGIEEEINKALRQYQDYTEVSEFFRSSDKEQINGKSHATSSKVCHLNRRVTNPLYKAYDPAGYQKSEDELVIDCIQTICNDFNTWMNSLVTTAKESKDMVTTKSDKLDHDTEELKVDSEYLFKILRTELELPENEDIY